MIRATELVARSPALGPVTFELDEGGRYALVGGSVDGPPLLLQVLAGVRAWRGGDVTVAGHEPGPCASVAYVPVRVDLPSALRVDELLQLAARLRGESGAAPAEQRLAVLGVDTLARRRIASLSACEARAVALVEAITSRAEVLLLEEPLVELEPRAIARLRDALARPADLRRTVVIATASREDARELTVEQLYFERGKLAHRATDEGAWHSMTSANPRLTLRSEGAHALLAALASEPAITDVESRGAQVTLSGSDAVAMARAVARAAKEARVEIELMEFARSAGVT